MIKFADVDGSLRQVHDLVDGIRDDDPKSLKSLQADTAAIQVEVVRFLLTKANEGVEVEAVVNGLTAGLASVVFSTIYKDGDEETTHANLHTFLNKMNELMHDMLEIRFHGATNAGVDHVGSVIFNKVSG